MHPPLFEKFLEVVEFRAKVGSEYSFTDFKRQMEKDMMASMKKAGMINGRRTFQESKKTKTTWTWAPRSL
jgi:hypothetical protein